MFDFQELGRHQPEAVGAVYTREPTFYGLGVRFEVRRGCEGRGFATEGLRQFVDEYWRQPRSAPVSAMMLEPRFFTSKDMKEDWDRVKEEVREIEHLIATMDPQDEHAQRVMEKLGLKPEEEEEMFPCYFYRLKKEKDNEQEKKSSGTE